MKEVPRDRLAEARTSAFAGLAGHSVTLRQYPGMRFGHALRAAAAHTVPEFAQSMTPNPDDQARVYLVRSARAGLAKLNPTRRAALTAGFQRVGSELLHSATQVEVAAGWKRRTWPRRRYPQQCYAQTIKYVLHHQEINGARLVHGTIAHAPFFVPIAHAWVELPGDVVFDGVVQAFF